MPPERDVIVVGGGPAGSVAAWDLARRGVDVLVLEREKFPREKVCGDYVEPRGLRIMRQMGCLQEIEAGSPLPISHSATYVDWECRYRGEIPFYGRRNDLLPHGYIIPRDVLDDALLRAASTAGARVEQQTAVGAVSVTRGGVQVEWRRGRRRGVHRSRLVMGADGANSVVARGAGLLANDSRHIAVAQRAYGEGLPADIGEALFFFDGDLFPGYGWMFPMAGGRVNLGVGILAEARQRLSINVPRLFANFVDGLRRVHPLCADLRLCAPPIGGVVKTYGAAGPNHFERGLLIGDAGSFVDPMTGEGITPAMESALLATATAIEALEAGRFDLAVLSAYERGFRAYFDPSMVFLDLCAATLRNHHLGGPWLRALARGCELAQRDQQFATTAGAYFGGLDIDPPGILGQVWVRMLRELAALLPRSMAALLVGRPNLLPEAFAETVKWQAAWWRSILDDPVWHTAWMMDVQRKWIRFLSALDRTAGDPRSEGIPFPLLLEQGRAVRLSPLSEPL